jgi:hypothetical protein
MAPRVLTIETLKQMVGLRPMVPPYGRAARGILLPDFDFQLQIDPELLGNLGAGQVDQT